MSTTIFTDFKLFFCGIFPGSGKPPGRGRTEKQKDQRRTSPGTIDGSGAAYIQLKQKKKNPGIGLGVESLAGNSNSGKKPLFAMSDIELSQFIEQYKLGAKNGDYVPSWPHLCGELGYTEQEIAQVIQGGAEPNTAYYNRAVMLKRAATWIRGQMLSSKAWNGPAQSKAIFALKQDIGDGYRYTDREQGSTGAVAISVNFGSGDTRSNRAVK